MLVLYSPWPSCDWQTTKLAGELTSNTIPSTCCGTFDECENELKMCTQQQCSKAVGQKENLGLEEILSPGYTVLADSVWRLLKELLLVKATQKHCGCVEKDIPQPSRSSVTPSSALPLDNKSRPSSQGETTTSTRVVKPALFSRETKRLSNLGFERESQGRSIGC